MKKLSILCSLFILFALHGCAPGTRTGETIGALTGIIAGAIIGYQVGGDSAAKTVGAGVGLVVGGLVGSELGKMYDKLNREEQHVHSSMISSTIETSKIGEGNQWYNPETGNSGRVIITKQEEYCREYQQTVVIGGKEQQAYGTACKQPDGSWKIQN
ncbi:MAG: RT0821/Lpp0805 family surface protein [Nitrospinaceae bacterium]|jgi:surface antigen|nr:RT0821/Lpp0805 family surface protein [Nitrospinaceae bacterium]|tara:strand:+ start:11136 stop:11606 length:471 start_codon:yes stop_codon:yes gene_type:complete